MGTTYICALEMGATEMGTTYIGALEMGVLK